jgi:hypothetical protein
MPGVVRKNSNAVKAAVCGMNAAFAGRAFRRDFPYLSLTLST